jgi:glutamate carboxypeptidase
MNTAGVPDSVFEGAVDLLEELCAISSPSGDLVGLERVAVRLADALGRFGFSSEVNAERGRDGRVHPVLVASTGRTAQRCVLLVGHLDTVLPAQPPRRHNRRLEGTGALDMKGGFAAFLGSLELLAARGDAIPDDLVLVGVPDEEIGGPISEDQMKSWGRRARAVLVLEPGELRREAETLVTGRRGLTVWRLEARGRAAHSGIAYWQGRSAIAAAATWCGAVQRLSQPGAGPLVNVGRIVGGDTEFVAGLAEEHRFIGTTQRLNVIADHCIAEGEVRFLSLEDGDRVLGRMDELARQIGDQTEVELRFERQEHIQPVDPSGPGRQMADRLVAAVARHGWKLEIEKDRGGVSFPNFLPDASTVPVLDGLGPGGAGMHTREESVDLRSLRRRIALIAEAILLTSDL